MPKPNLPKTYAIALAAGKGKRMESDIPKVLHKLAGSPMITYTLKTLKSLKLPIIIVLGHKAPDVIKTLGKNYIYAIQKKRMGTGDAVKAALRDLPSDIETVLVVNGDDSAFYRSETIRDFLKFHIENQNDLSLLYTYKKDPTGFGRVKKIGDKIIKIVEEKDATKEEKKIKEINTGIFCFNIKFLKENLKKLSKSKVSGEYYLTELVEIGSANDFRVCGSKLKNSLEWMSINTVEQLEQADHIMRKNVKKL